MARTVLGLPLEDHLIAVAASGWLGWRALRRRDERAVARDPELAALSHPMRGEALAVRSWDGTRLQAEVFGSSADPTIVLIHGWTCSSRLWQYQLAELAEDHRIVAYDLRGHGRSAPPANGDYSMEALAADLDAVLRAGVTQGQRTVVVGHSAGAMSVAAWAGTHPDQVQSRLAGTVLVDTGMERLIAESRLPLTVTALSRIKVAAGRRIIGLPVGMPRRSTPFLHRAVRYVALSRTASPAQVAFCQRMFADCPAGARAALGLTLSDLDLRDALPALDVPTVVVVGELDRLTPPVHARSIAEALPGAVLVEIPAVGHMTPLEAHADVSRHIRELVRRVLPVNTGQDGRTAPREERVMDSSDGGEWYWCLRHKRPEPAGEQCAADDRLGPYPSREKALQWRQRVDDRNERWRQQDREWEGDD